MGLKKLLAQSIIWRGFYFFSVLLVNVFLSRYLKAAGTGNLYFITIIFSFVQAVLSLGIEPGITYFGSGNLMSRNKLFGLAGAWSVVAGLLMLPIIYIFFLLDASIDISLLQPYCIYGFCFVSGLSLMNYITALYYTQENYFLPNLLLSLINIAFVIIVPGKNESTSLAEVNKIILIYFLTMPVSGLFLYIAFIITNKNEKALAFPSKKEFSPFFKYSLTALIANVIFFLVYRIDYLFVNNSPVCTAADLGNYIQVSKLGQMMLIVPQIVASVVFPRTASGVERERLNNSIMIMARLFSQLFLIAFFAVLVIGKPLFTFVFGATFNKMQAPMLVLIPGIFSLSVLALLSAYFSGKGKVNVNVQGAILALIVMIVGDFFLVPVYGIIAAAAISTLSYSVNLGFALYIFYKDYDINLADFFRWRKTDYYWIKNLIAKKAEE